MTPDARAVRALIRWFGREGHDFPWRNTRDRWAILVSEVMLQSTQVSRVVPYYEAWMTRWPGAADLAAAPLGEVLAQWQGLGYPRRARNLHACAAAVEAAGAFPDTLDELLALPGIGPYTARAILTFAFERDVAVVDTNIARVYARLLGRRLTPKEVQTAADDALVHGDSWAWNQCLMDLGAVLCRPGTPRCHECPLASGCAWRGGSEPDPATGSAGGSTPQGRFDGSDRQARGRLMQALTVGAVGVSAVAEVMARDATTSARLVDDLCREGLVVRDRDALRLPG